MKTCCEDEEGGADLKTGLNGMDWLMAAESAPPGDSTGYLKLALMLAAIGALGLFSRWRKSKLPPAPDLKALREREANADAYRDAADRALVDLIETGREISAQVDTKIRLLNKLVKDADTRIRGLEEILAKVKAREYPPPSQDMVSPPTAIRDSARVSGKNARMNTDDAPLPRSELHKRVSALHAEGKTRAEIARAANLSLVEVRLALSQIDASDTDG